jgi:carboxyl-terminal processing protease
MRMSRCIPVLAVWLLAFTLVRAADSSIKLKALRQQAELCEQLGEWDKACLLYESILRAGRGQPDIHERYQKCLRRYWQVRRNSDPSYRREVLSLDYAQSLRLYKMIRDTLMDNALEKQNVGAGRLFRKGLEEFDNALTEPEFLQRFLPTVELNDIRAFREFLKKNWSSEAKLTKAQAEEQLRKVALAAQNRLQLSGSVVFMEFACGACYALDDYTLYLTPNQLRELCDSLRGEFAGVGLTLRLLDNKLVIADIVPFSPADEISPPLGKDDSVISIDKKPVGQMIPEAATELLEGPVGSFVELEVYSPGMAPRTVTLRRRLVFTPSISYRMINERVAYLHIACFQDSTVQEIDDALASLTKQRALKGVILDIRGNHGGIFEVAIEVARRFLAAGVIASTQNSDPKFNTIYQARNPAALTLPLVVLIDGETASAAEVLAGALKDNKRGRLVGQTTFGKGCTQCILKLPPAPGGVPTGGMRLTVARFFSPEGVPYSGRGVSPHVIAESLFLGSMSGLDQQMDAALLEMQRSLDLDR